MSITDFVKKFDKGEYPNLIGKSQDQIKKEAVNKLTQEERVALGLMV